MRVALHSLSLLALTLQVSLLASPGLASAASMSLDAIRSDAEQSATWDGRLTACTEYIDASEKRNWEKLNKLFVERINQDQLKQTNDPHVYVGMEEAAPPRVYVDSNQTKTDPRLPDYLHALYVLYKNKEGAAEKAQSATPASCKQMTQAFTPFITAFAEKVERIAREQQAEKIANAPAMEWVNQLEKALGKDGKHSDPVKLQQLWDAHPEFTSRVPDNLLCKAANYSDPQGLEFIASSSIGPRLLSQCSFMPAFEQSLYTQHYDNTLWLAGHAGADGQEMALSLIRYGFNMKGEDQQILLLPALERLLASGLNVNTPMEGGSLLSRAMEKTTLFASAMLAHGVNPNSLVSSGIYGQRPLLTAALQVGDLDMFRKLLKTPGIKINATDQDGESVLDAAIIMDRIDIVKMLFKAGASLQNVYYLKQYVTPLMLTKSVAMTRLLLAHGANPRWQDTNGNTVLPYLIFRRGYNNNASESIRTLVAAGLLLNHKNKYGATFLNYVDQEISQLKVDELQTLISLGAKYGKPDKRLAFAYGPGEPVIDQPYIIRLANGKTINGRTDFFGKASWVPSGQKYSAEILRTSP